MAALGILIAYILYFFMAAAGFAFGWKAFSTKAAYKKTKYGILSILCFVILSIIIISNKKNHHIAEQRFIGTYYLTQYPNCDSCLALLKEDNSFEVRSSKEAGKLLEKGKWHYVASGDFLGVYMDEKENDLLGFNRFEYSHHIDRNNKIFQAPKLGP